MHEKARRLQGELVKALEALCQNAGIENPPSRGLEGPPLGQRLPHHGVFVAWKISSSSARDDHGGVYQFNLADGARCPQ